MQAVILLGGKGTRLADLYPDRPKALVPVAGRSFIEWQVDWLRRGGVTDIHLAAGHLADQIEVWAAGQDRVTVSREPRPLGTGGALTFIEPFLLGDRFLLVNGDTLLPNLDFHRVENKGAGFSIEWKNTPETFPLSGKISKKVSIEWKKPPDFFHRVEKYPPNVSIEWKIVIAVTRIESAGRFGTVEFDSTGVITAFREKAERRGGWINGGVYWMPRACLDHLQPDTVCSLETDLFPQWVKEQRLLAFPGDPPLLDMGTPEGLTEMTRWLKSHVPGKQEGPTL